MPTLKKLLEADASEQQRRRDQQRLQNQLLALRLQARRMLGEELNDVEQALVTTWEMMWDKNPSALLDLPDVPDYTSQVLLTHLQECGFDIALRTVQDKLKTFSGLEGERNQSRLNAQEAKEFLLLFQHNFQPTKKRSRR